jgi:lactoylglutathione lyase
MTITTLEPDGEMAEPISVRGLFEAHLTVSDMDRAVAFYRDVVGLVVAHEVPERGATFFWVGSPGDGMLGLWSLGSAPVTLALHVAFTVAMPDVLGACGHLRARGVTPLSFFGSETEEPSVIGWMPAAAVYFRDPDGHQLEYLAMLDAAPRPELGIVPWSQWPAGGPGVDIRWHVEGRTELRPLFELAEDSSERLDHYIDLGRVLVAYDERSIAGHLQLRARQRAGRARAAEHGRRRAPPTPRHRARPGAARYRRRSRRGRPQVAGGDGHRRHRQPALLPADGLPHAGRRA